MRLPQKIKLMRLVSAFSGRSLATMHWWVGRFPIGRALWLLSVAWTQSAASGPEQVLVLERSVDGRIDDSVGAARRS
jgi:hypothetical protein